MINPAQSDIGRRVKLNRFEAPPLVGVLIAVGREVQAHDMSVRTVAMVRYDGEKLPVATDMGRLDWE